MLVAIDTATRIASLALHDGLRIQYEATWEAGRNHTVQLTPRLIKALDDLGLEPEGLSGAAVALGPGSYTGLRVGLAVAKGLALSQNLPLVGVPTLDILAAAQGRDRRPLVAVLQAGRGRICVSTYRWRSGWQRRTGPRLVTWKELGGEVETSTLFCGEIDERGREILGHLGELATLLPSAHRLRRAGFLADLAWARIRQDQVDDPVAVKPIYLSPST
ncbi:MAG: tRNA (adenosine(37)-N6)-threonylcarbamoyltransferase complex dimerization subunit type 1 TsaB [Anaerolineae bacterium]|jgi:tRNA threonylcarbamoyladenosine biosynthesis protein TsaB